MEEPEGRITVITTEAKREKFFDHCRRLKPKRMSMNAALNAMIDAVLAGKISLPELAEKPAGKGKGSRGG